MLFRSEYDKIRRVFVSAHTGEGVDLLRQAITRFAQSGANDPGSFPTDELTPGLGRAESAGDPLT